MSKKTIALIVARKGSKRIPGKNIRILGDKPLIQYSIEHAQASKLIDEIVVSTDDEKAIEIAKILGCTVIERPSLLATDKAKTLDVIKHCVEYFELKNDPIYYLVLLQPTVPFRDVSKLDEAIQILSETGCDSVISHIEVDYFHPNRMKKISEGRIIPYCEEEIENVPRSELPKAYYRDGAIYAMRADLPVKENTIFGSNIRPIINNRDKFVNIDEEKDWVLAELMLQSS